MNAFSASMCVHLRKAHGDRVAMVQRLLVFILCVFLNFNCITTCILNQCIYTSPNVASEWVIIKRFCTKKVSECVRDSSRLMFRVISVTRERSVPALQYRQWGGGGTNIRERRTPLSHCVRALRTTGGK